MTTPTISGVFSTNENLRLETLDLSRNRFERERDAKDRGAIDFDVFESGLGAVGFQSHAILGRVGRQSKNKFACLAGDTRIEFLCRLLIDYSSEFNSRPGHTAAIFGENA